MQELSTQKPLPYPVYFISKNIQVWQDVMESPHPPPVEQIIDRFRDGNDSWSVQTYVQLKRRGLNVHLVPRYIPGQICVTSYDHLGLRDYPFHSYVVACQHDRGRPEICEQRIVQNRLNVIDSTDHFIPFWPQVALKPRDRCRGSKVETIVYKGRSIYFAQPFQSPEFLQQLQSLGMTLSLSTDLSQGGHRVWTDYRQADVVLAVRNCTEYDLSIKPASKLINAWFAGCPALLGPEPAFEHLRQSELDYIEVRSPQDAIAALKRLRDEPELYAAMVENGFRRAKDFTPDRIALLWRDLLAGSIAEGYNRWLSQSPIQKLIGRPIKFMGRAIKHKREKQRFWVSIRNS
ncbi:MAG: hypothetical protein RID09_31250 [Coleofasciculus sp. G1-WW12-02]|uniref:glycosyltransferase n=1 Tax=Coleofasciculus sp. G1-WW12-02 TaxID=3068483 RepID=UPI0032F0DDBF